MSGPRENLDGLNDLSDDERHLERLLAALLPRESRLDRERTMFLAGQASAVGQLRSSNRWRWPAATLASAAAGLLAGLLISAPHPREAFDASFKNPREDGAVRQRSIVAQHTDRVEAFAEVTPPMDGVRIRMLTGTGDGFLLAQADEPFADKPAVGGNPARGPFVGLTYGQFVGRLLENEEHQ
jgi:hypothetical protein